MSHGRHTRHSRLFVIPECPAVGRDPAKGGDFYRESRTYILIKVLLLVFINIGFYSNLKPAGHQQLFLKQFTGRIQLMVFPKTAPNPSSAGY